MSEPKRMTEERNATCTTCSDHPVVYESRHGLGRLCTGCDKTEDACSCPRASVAEKDEKLREQAKIIVALAGVVGSELARQHTAHGGAGNALSCDYALCKRLVSILKRAHEATRDGDFRHYAADAYAMADAMIKAREAK